LTHANPSFLDARDAILHALDDLKAAGRLSPSTYETVRHACWQAFARYGMGFRASSNGPNLDGVVADESLPPGV
jgi:extracellular elastinolytic metalloproteinase